jgi:hypothetical protein
VKRDLGGNHSNSQGLDQQTCVQLCDLCCTCCSPDVRSTLFECVGVYERCVELFVSWSLKPCAVTPAILSVVLLSLLDARRFSL